MMAKEALTLTGNAEQFTTDISISEIVILDVLSKIRAWSEGSPVAYIGTRIIALSTAAQAKKIAAYLLKMTKRAASVPQWFLSKFIEYHLTYPHFLVADATHDSEPAK